MQAKTIEVESPQEIHLKIKDKIFQLFFTTKPIGSGLSLSYDIVKAHGGELKVKRLSAGKEGKEKKGYVFSVELPINKTIK